MPAELPRAYSVRCERHAATKRRLTEAEALLRDVHPGGRRVERLEWKLRRDAFLAAQGERHDQG